MNQEHGHNPQSKEQSRIVLSWQVLIIVRAELATANKKGLRHAFAMHWHLLLLVFQDELLRFLLELCSWITHHYLCTKHGCWKIDFGQERSTVSNEFARFPARIRSENGDCYQLRCWECCIVSCKYVDMYIRPLRSS